MQISERDFLRCKEALIRAAYRSLLGREPEHISQVSNEPVFSPTDEADLKETLDRFLSSPEFRSRQRRDGVHTDYPAGSWARIEINDLKLWIDMGDLGVSRLCVTGSYEPAETSFVRSFLRPGMTFVDIGANIGWFSATAAQIVGPTGHVFAFEPRQETFKALSRTIADNDFALFSTLTNAALGSSPGETFIGWHEEAGNPGGTWSLPYADLQDRFRQSGAKIQPTPVVTLDSIVGDHPVDMIKIDIEGAEPLALGGAEQVIVRSKPIILCEINAPLLAQVSQSSPADLAEKFVRLGYSAHLLTNEGILGEKITDWGRIGVDQVANVVFRA